MATVSSRMSRTGVRAVGRATAPTSQSRVGGLADELAELLPDRSVIDGELVALAPGLQGEPGQDFNRLWRTVFGAADDHLSLVVFDAPVLAGEPLAARPWHERRNALEAALPTPGAAVSLIDVFDADPVVHDRLVTLGFEGSVLKRRDGRYLPGQRSRSWRNHKTERAARRSSRSRSPIAASVSNDWARPTPSRFAKAPPGPCCRHLRPPRDIALDRAPRR